MKYLPYLLSLSFLLLTACRTPGPNDPPCGDPLREWWQGYQGEQQAWPVSSGAFTTTVDKIQFFHGNPNRPYTVLGRVTRKELNQEDLAQCARSHRGDAVSIVDQREINVGTKHDPGFLLPMGNAILALPGADKADLQTVTTAYIIKFKP